MHLHNFYNTLLCKKYFDHESPTLLPPEILKKSFSKILHHLSSVHHPSTGSTRFRSSYPVSKVNFFNFDGIVGIVAKVGTVVKVGIVAKVTKVIKVVIAVKIVIIVKGIIDALHEQTYPPIFKNQLS